eukprot:1157280-Pelagomonas_calceolata.AAC.12
MLEFNCPKSQGLTTLITHFPSATFLSLRKFYSVHILPEGLLKRDIPEAYWLPLQPPNSAVPLHTHQRLESNNWRKKFQSLPHDIHICSHRCPQARAAFHPATYKKTFASKTKNWREITYTGGSVIQHKHDSPPLVGSGVNKPSRDTTQQLQLYINPNGNGPTNTINRAELVGILVALQEGHIDIADSAPCLSQIPKQTLNPMRMRTHLHSELIQDISNIPGIRVLNILYYLTCLPTHDSPHPVHFYKVKAHSGIIGNEGADACARAAALTDTTDFALPDARDPFHNFYWLTLKSSHGSKSETHHSHATPTHYLTNLTDKLKTHMHNRHKLGSADTYGYYYNSWQRLNYTIWSTHLNTTVSPEAYSPSSQLANKAV